MNYPSEALDDMLDEYFRRAGRKDESTSGFHAASAESWKPGYNSPNGHVVCP